jgi:hypothetical protein
MANLTNLTKKKLLEEFEKNGQHVSNACKVAGISRETFYQWGKEDPEFSQAIEDIKQSFNDELITLAKQGLKANIEKQYQSAIEYTLNNKCKDEYSNTQKTELTGNISLVIKKINYTKDKNVTNPGN